MILEDVAKTSMTQLSIDDNFDWSTQKEVTLKVQSLNQDVLHVTSTDNSTTYYKGSWRQNDSDVKIIVPSFIEVLLVNGDKYPANNEINVVQSKNKLSKGAKALLFFDDFEDGDFSDWDLYKYTSGLHGDVIDPFTSEGQLYITQRDQQNVFVLNGSESWKNNIIEFNIMIDKIYDDVGKGFGIRFNANSIDVNDKGQPIANCYSFSISGRDRRWKLYRAYVDGSPAYKLAEGRRRFEKNRKYYFRISSIDNRVKVEMIEDCDEAENTETEVLIDVVDNSDPLNGGKLMFTGWDDRIILDNIKVTGEYMNPEDDSDNDGIEDGDDDYPYTPNKAFNNHYPAAESGSIIFEDLHPGKGDCDFNDLVMDYRFTVESDAQNKVQQVKGWFCPRAAGAAYINGFGFQLDEANENLPTMLKVSGMKYSEGYINNNANGWEENQAKPTLVLCDNIYNTLQNPGGAVGVNTTKDGAYVVPDTIYITMTPTMDITMNDIALNSFNPFLIVDRERAHEIHLPD